MHWSIDYDQTSGFIRVTCEGDFTVDDCISLKKDYLARDFWRPGMDILIDYRKTKFNNVGLESIRRIGDFHISQKDLIGGGKQALLMRTARDFGLARQYELITEADVPTKIMVFQDESEALGWLRG